MMPITAGSIVAASFFFRKRFDALDAASDVFGGGLFIAGVFFDALDAVDCGVALVVVVATGCGVVVAAFFFLFGLGLLLLGDLLGRPRPFALTILNCVFVLGCIGSGL